MSSVQRTNTLSGYAFVGWIFSIISYVIFLVWTLVPEPVLHSLGLTYYPSKHWAVAVPAYLIVCALLLLCVYVGLTMIRLPKFSSFNAIVDSHTSLHRSETELLSEKLCVPHAADLPIGYVSRSFLEHSRRKQGSVENHA